MVKYLSVILVVLATLFRAQAATSSGVQVVGLTNFLAGTVTISNAVPSTVIGVDAGKKLVSTLLTTLEANALHGTEAVLTGTTPTLTWATNSVSYFQSISADTTFVFANTPTDTNLVKRIDYWLIGDGTHVLTNTANTISFEPTFPGVIPTGTNLIRFTWVGGLVHADVTWKQNATDGLVAQVGGTMTNAAITSELSLSGNTLGVGAALAGKTLTAPTATFPTINYAYLGTNNTSFGFYVTGVTNSSGGTINQWEAVYVKSDGSIDKADADGSGTYPAWGLATAAITTGTTGTIITLGNVRNDSWTFTAGATVWISTTAGALTTTAPSTTGNQLQPIGKAITATQLLLRPSQDYATVQ